MIVVIESFFLNMEGLLNLTLKHIDNFKAIKHSIWQLHVQALQTKTPETSNIVKVNDENTRTTSGSSIVNFENISQFICTYTFIAEFEQINAGWVSVYSFRK